MMMKHISRSRTLWVSATIISAILYYSAFKLFPTAFPIVHVDISMNLEEAIEQADTITEKYHFGPSDYHNAAMFSTDHNVKTFVELEAGGKDAFVAMMDDKLYMPYTWRVRHFKEHETNECTIAFTPDGKPYGFIETISENVPGAQLSEHDARAIAENDATTAWNVNLDSYKLVEASQKKETSQRIDHTFVYERINEKIGEGLYRLKIVVSGDKTTELTHFVKIPESFTRRYAEMRSANTTIAFAATLFMQLFYIFGGCLFGLYWLSKRRLYILKPSTICAFILACGTTLASINQLPFWWMSYNSASSIHGFLMQLFLMFFMILLGQTALLTLIITAAEGLTRSAFANHPQLWSLWKPENSASYAVLGRTLGGYLMVGFNIAFVIGFYLISLRYWGWWSPSETLFDPNILATYVPWFAPIVQSLNAGFMEECLFRAIPLAGAALLGQRFGKRNLFIGIAFIIQAIVFGAAHATYPVQPSYARLVELLIPSLIWGATYLKFGLLPTIIAHFTYDVIWFSLPIFVSSAPDALSQKMIIILLTLLPLFVVVYARLKRGSWHELPKDARNAAWQPLTVVEKEETAPETTEIVAPVAQRKKIVIMLGIIGLIAWCCMTRFTHDGITLTRNRAAAIARSSQFLQEKNIALNAPWKTLPLIFSHYKTVPQIAAQHTFIWKKGKKELYHTLLGTYLEPAHWTIRYAQFDTDIIQRAEEHKVMIAQDDILRHFHQLPETTPGVSLSQQEARIIAHQALQDQFNLAPSAVTEISATQTQLPNRVNWLFIFSDSAVYPLQTGQARIAIAIAGDTVIDAARLIHVPEDWTRKEHNKQNMLTIVLMIFYLIFVFCLLLAAAIAYRQKKTFIFSKRTFVITFGIFLILTIIDIMNGWETIVGSFNTSLPLHNQLFQFIAALALQAFIRSAFCALTCSYVLSYTTRHTAHNAINVGAGIGIGFVVAGIMTCASKLIALNMPLWPSYDVLGYSVPLVSSVVSAIMHYVLVTVAFSLLFMLIDTATSHWQKNRIIFTLIAALCGMSMIDLPSLKVVPLWMLVGTGIGLLFIALYHHVIRYNYALIPLATACYIILHIIQQGIFNAYPGAMIAAVASACAVIIASGVWYGYLTRAHR
jgi:hypothetical protein